MIEISDRQKEIIDSAGRILTQSGVSGLTTKKLAKEMGFSEAAIYRHFSSKEEIILSLLRYLGENMDSRLAEVIHSGANPEENLLGVFRSQFQFFEQNPHFVVAVFSDGLLEESEQINQAILNLMQIKMKYLMPIILAGQQEGYFTRKVSADELVHITLGAFRLHMFKWRISNFKMNIQQSGTQMIQSILNLIKV